MTASSKSPVMGLDADSWNAVAHGYDAVTRSFMEHFSELALGHLATSFGLGSSCRLLDVACGPGTSSLLAADRVAAIDAVDYSKDMLGVFHQHLATRGVSNVRLTECDGQHLPFSDRSFHCAISMFGLMFFPDRVQGLREIHRVLLPGGGVAVSSWAPVDISPAMTAMVECLRSLDPSRPAPTRNLGTWENPELVQQELVEAGFENVEVFPEEGMMRFSSADQYWDDMTRGAVPIVMMRKNMGEDAFNAMAEHAKAFLRDYIGERRELGSTAYIAIGRRPKA